MSKGFVIYFSLQAVVSVLLIIGYMHEKEIIDFEKRICIKIKKLFKKG